MADVIVANTSPGIAGKTLACHDTDGVTTGLWTLASPLALKGGVSGSQTWRLGVAGSGNLTVLADGTGAGLSLNTAGDIFEKTRTTPLGHWIDVPFAPANFTASAGTWTIGSVTTNCYTLMGKTLVYQFAFLACGISATPQTLDMALPAGLVLPKFAVGVVHYNNAGVIGIGMVFTDLGGSALRLARNVAIVPWATDSTLQLYGSIIAPLT